MSYSGTEKRKHRRVNGRFMVSYRILEETDDIAITQTKNLSLGGMLITTNKKFNPGTTLAIEIRLPFEGDPIMLVGKVVESLEITQGLIYDTRVEFLSVDDKHKDIMNKTVDYYSNK
jgi:hypothetical protein